MSGRVQRTFGVFAVLMISLLVVFIAPPQAQAASIVVNTTLDFEDEIDGRCSFREALTAAKNDTAAGATPGECAAGSGADVITFATGGTFPITSRITITSEVTIDGTDAPTPVIFDGGGNNGVFQLRSKITLKNVTITGGSDVNAAGLSVPFDADVVLDGVHITDNHSTGITSINGGGGMYVSGAAKIEIRNSTISANTAGGRGGGIYAQSPTATFTIVNTTISGNTATIGGGGMLAFSTPVNVSFTTVTNNTAPTGAGINTAAPDMAMTIEASLVADNVGDDFVGGATSGGFNVFGVVSLTPAATDITGQSGVGLGPLTGNGGTTPTHLPSAESPAIAFVTGAVTNDQPLDQRGMARSVGSKEAGAVEFVSAVLDADNDNFEGPAGDGSDCDDTDPDINPDAVEIPNNGIDEDCDDADLIEGSGPAGSITVTTTTDVVDGNDELCSLREALTSANTDTESGPVRLECRAGSGTDLIRFEVGGRFITTSQLSAASPMTIDGATAPTPVIIDANGSDRVMAVNEVVTINDLTITGGSTMNSGAGINNGFAADTTLLRVTIDANDATNPGIGGGGGLNLVAPGKLTIIDSTVSNNTAAKDGGGILVGAGGQDGATFTIVNSTVSGNSTAGHGGGISIDGDSDAIISFTTITDNVAAEGSSGLSSSVIANPFIEASIIADNHVVPDLGGYTSGGFNVFGPVQNPASQNPAASDLIDQANIGLGALSNNDGTTLTHLPVAGAPGTSLVTGVVTIDQATDQTGLARTAGSKEAGSVELVDGDGDGFAGAAGDNADCDDGNVAVNPFAVDIPDDGIDQDCDGQDLTLAVCLGLPVTINMTTGASGVGTAGDDVILGTSGADVIDAGDGNDTVCGGDGDDTILGGNGDDSLFGEGGRDIARGGPGEDTVLGGAGNDRLLGGIGDDTIIGGEGNDYLGGFGGADYIEGGPGNETIFGGFGPDTIEGGDGDDVIRGLIGDDVINGGAGNDTLDGDRGNDTISGGPGDDTIRGGNANDVLNGNGGKDTVSGGKADDALSGGGGDADTCIGNLQIVADTHDGTCETVFGIP